MELRIVGSELELAEFIKALGNGVGNMIVNPKIEDVNPKISEVKPKKTEIKPKAIVPMVDTAYLVNKHKLTGQCIRNYAKLGMPHEVVDNKYRYNEAEASKWIEKYQKSHKSGTRHKKYNRRVGASVNTKSKIKKAIIISDYTKWRRNISAICRTSGMDEGKLLSNTYKYMTKTYGIVWDQENKDFFKSEGRKPASTLEVIYKMQQNNKVYTNLLESCLDTVIKESK